MFSKRFSPHDSLDVITGMLLDHHVIDHVGVDKSGEDETTGSSLRDGPLVMPGSLRDNARMQPRWRVIGL